MENPKRHNVRASFHTLKECLEDKDYLKAQERMEEIQKRYRKMLKDDDIEPADWDDISI